MGGRRPDPVELGNVFTPYHALGTHGRAEAQLESGHPAQARELIRSIQEARKISECRLDERIKLELPAWPKELQEEIKRKTLVDELIQGPEIRVIRY